MGTRAEKQKREGQFRQKDESLLEDTETCRDVVSSGLQRAPSKRGNTEFSVLPSLLISVPTSAIPFKIYFSKLIRFIFRAQAHAGA